MPFPAFSANQDKQIQTKISQLQAESRILWPQYDKHLNTTISKDLVYTLIQEAF